MKNDEELESAELTLEELELVVGGQTPEAAREYRVNLINDYLASIRHQTQVGLDYQTLD